MEFHNHATGVSAYMLIPIVLSLICYALVRKAYAITLAAIACAWITLLVLVTVVYPRGHVEITATMWVGYIWLSYAWIRVMA